MKKYLRLLVLFTFLVLVLNSCGITKKASDDSDSSSAWIKYRISSTDTTLSGIVDGSFKDRDGVIKTFSSLAPTVSVTYYQYPSSNISECGYSAGPWTASLGDAYIQVINPSNATLHVYIINNNDIVASGMTTTVGATVTVQYAPF